MKGDTVPDDHHITRFCRPSHIAEDGTPRASAFMLRAMEEYLSVNWLEHLKLPDRNSEIADIRRIMAQKMSVKETSRLAVLNVGRALTIVRQESDDHRVLSVLHEPTEGHKERRDPSHSGIYNCRHDEDSIAKILARAIQEVHKATAG